MSQVNPDPNNKKPLLSPSASKALKKIWAVISYRWGVKLLSFLLALLLWGGLISQDGNLTREKVFTDVPIYQANGDTLLRNGLIVVEGLDDLPTLKMKADVPQKNYDVATANSFNVRVDLSRIKQPGVQKLPVLYSNSAAYGNVTYLSVTEVDVHVDEYITRRRIPVQINLSGSMPKGFYATPPSVDPAQVVVSGPRKLVETISRVVVPYDLSELAPIAGNIVRAVPFELYDKEDNIIHSSLISVTSESILIDSILAEQTLYKLSDIAVNLSGITVGRPAEGYRVVSVKADPKTIQVAGSDALMKSLSVLDVAAPISIDGAKETLIRAVQIKKPGEAVYLSQNAVYITVEIAPVQGGK